MIKEKDGKIIDIKLFKLSTINMLKEEIDDWMIIQMPDKYNNKRKVNKRIFVFITEEEYIDATRK